MFKISEFRSWAIQDSCLWLLGVKFLEHQAKQACSIHQVTQQHSCGPIRVRLLNLEPGWFLPAPQPAFPLWKINPLHHPIAVTGLPWTWLHLCKCSYEVVKETAKQNKTKQRTQWEDLCVSEWLKSKFYALSELFTLSTPLLKTEGRITP